MSITAAFVDRTHQLAQLDRFLTQALSAHGQICFVTGDAGAGKTTLALEFIRRAEARQPDLVAAVAMGDPQTGASDPYLIFREVLALLTGDVEARLAEGAITQEGARRLQSALRTSIDCLVEFGPDLIGLFVPGAGLAVQLTKIGIETGKRAGLLERLTQAPAEDRTKSVGPRAIDPGQVYEQYAKVLTALAQHSPLLLVLDDLQWADSASIDLLFHLTRRIESSRIFIIAMLRPAEIALGRAGERHPLERVMSEVKRYYGDVILDLDEAAQIEGVAFIDALLDSEPNRLGPTFRRALLERTGGNPLFAVELLREMEEKGDLVRDEQALWSEGPALDWATLPARAEGVIESRISRLTSDLLEALKLASVQGDAFTAEVVAQIRALNTRDFVRQLSSELEKRHRLVTAQGQQRVGEQRLSQYQFQNRLFQQYLYAGLDPTERAYLHEDIGRALETLYGERADEIATRLAWHFEQAGVTDKARRYLRRAGEQAAARAANVEAIDFFTRALALTPTEDWDERFALLLGRAQAFHLLGRRDAQAGDLYDLDRLAEKMADPTRQIQVALERSYYSEATHDYPAARTAADRAIAYAQAARAEDSEMAARVQLGWVLFRQGEYAAAIDQAQFVLAMARVNGSKPMQAESLRLSGACHQERGELASGHSYLEEALHLYEELGDPRGESKVASNLAVNMRGEHRFVEAKQWYDRALAMVRNFGDRRNEVMILNNLGVLSISIGDIETGRNYYEQASVIAREVGERMLLGATWVNLSTICRIQEDFAQALVYGRQALAIFTAIGTPYGEGHAWMRIGHAQVGLGQLDEAVSSYSNALTLRRQSGELQPALETLAGLARTHLLQGDAARALQDLDEVLPHIANGDEFKGAEEPLWIFLTAYQVLRANNDPRAEVALATAYQQLQDKAAKFADDRTRAMFLANIPHHRAIVKIVTGEDPPAPQPFSETVAPQAESVSPAAAAPSFTVPLPAAEPAPTPVPTPAPTPAPAPGVAPAPSESPGTRARTVMSWLRRPAVRRGAFALAAGLLVVAALALVLPQLSSPRTGCSPACAGADLAWSNWQGEKLVGVDFSHANLYGAHFAKADLVASTFVSATLAAADLSAANLRGADLRTANLRGASLVGANLTSADLRGTTLVGADLTGANLTDVDLAGANLAAAELTDVTLTGSRYDANTRWPFGFAPPADPP
jgi:predicted ATPase